MKKALNVGGNNKTIPPPPSMPDESRCCLMSMRTCPPASRVMPESSTPVCQLRLMHPMVPTMSGIREAIRPTVQRGWDIEDLLHQPPPGLVMVPHVLSGDGAKIEIDALAFETAANAATRARFDLPIR
jgi:hypothetical protein